LEAIYNFTQITGFVNLLVQITLRKADRPIIAGTHSSYQSATLA